MSCSNPDNGLIDYCFMETAFHFNRRPQSTHALTALAVVGQIFGGIEMTACEQMACASEKALQVSGGDQSAR